MSVLWQRGCVVAAPNGVDPGAFVEVQIDESGEVIEAQIARVGESVSEGMLVPPEIGGVGGSS